MKALMRVLRTCAAAALLTSLGVSVSIAWGQTPLAPPAPRPITLAEALTLAGQNNPGLRVAAFDVTVARAQLAQAEAFSRGIATLNAQYTRIAQPPATVITIPPGTIPNQPDPIIITLPAANPNIYQIGLTYQVPLFSGGRKEAQIALAQASLRGAQAALARVQQQLVLDVKQGYYQVLLAVAGIDVAQRTLTSAEENLRVARARVAAGASPRFDEVQAEVSVATARQGLIRARNTGSLSQHALNNLMGLPQDTALAPRESMTVVALRADLPELIRRAQERRPEILEQQARIAVASAAVELARAGARPLVALNAGPTFGNSSGLGGAASAAFGWSVTIAASMTVFDGNLTAEKIREAEARVEQLKAVEVQLRQGVELEVRRAVLNYQTAVEDFAAAEAAVTAAQEQLRIANVRFSAGVSTNLEVVVAQQALSAAEAGRIQALFNVNQALAQLERATGGPIV